MPIFDPIRWEPLPHCVGCVYVAQHKNRKAGIYRTGIGESFKGSIDGVMVGEYYSPMTAFADLNKMLRTLPSKPADIQHD